MVDLAYRTNPCLGNKTLALECRRLGGGGRNETFNCMRHVFNNLMRGQDEGRVSAEEWKKMQFFIVSEQLF